MRVGVIPETWLERLGLATGLAPVPLAEGFFGFLLARTVMVATRLGVFEALEPGAKTARAVAEACKTDVVGTERILHALAGCRYVTVSAPANDGDDAVYALSAMARRWVLASADGSCRDKLLLQFLEWEWFEHAETYVRTGRHKDVFGALPADGWGLYQRGMRAGADPLAAELATRVRLPRNPTAMLDLGGGHGHYSVAFCLRHPTLSATILELPEAIPHAAPVLAKDGLEGRVRHRAGDIRQDDLGDAAYDLILAASVLHHLDDDACRALLGRIARALKPGGVVTIFDVFRRGKHAAPGQVGGLLDLFLATISPAGTRSPETLASFERDAGLSPRRPLRLRIAPDIGAQCAVKPLG